MRPTLWSYKESRTVFINYISAGCSVPVDVLSQYGTVTAFRTTGTSVEFCLPARETPL